MDDFPQEHRIRFDVAKLATVVRSFHLPERMKAGMECRARAANSLEDMFGAAVTTAKRHEAIAEQVRHGVQDNLAGQSPLNWMNTHRKHYHGLPTKRFLSKWQHERKLEVSFEWFKIRMVTSVRCRRRARMADRILSSHKSGRIFPKNDPQFRRIETRRDCAKVKS